MSSFAPIALLALCVVLTGCSGANALTFGTDPNAGPNGSYAGYTMNSSVSDQNPHVGGGGDSYPTSTSAGKLPPPPDQADGR